MRKNVFKPFFLMVCLLMIGTAVFAKTEKVVLKGNLKGVKKSSVIVYDFESHAELAEGEVVNGIFEVEFEADTRGQKCFVYLSKFDDGSYNPQASMGRYFFVDGKKMTVKGKMRMGGLSGFKQLNCKIYDDYRSVDDCLDMSELQAATEKLLKINEEKEMCPNVLRKKKYQRVTMKLRDNIADVELKMYADYLKQVKKEDLTEGINAKIYEKIGPYRYSYIKPFIQLYTEKFGEDYFEKSYYAGKLLTRYQIISMYREGTPVYDASLRTLDDKIVKMSDFKGQNIYMCLWDSDHDRSGKDVKVIGELAKKFKNKKIAFVVVNLNPSLDNWRDLAKNYQSENVIHLSMDEEYEENMNILHNQTFKYVYKTKRYPRAILIDEDQKMIDWNAMLPTNANVVKELKKAL